jgi:hypothetical protein
MNLFEAMTPPDGGVTHLAGPMVELVQRCARCGAILFDYRNSMTTGVGYVRGWEVGKRIVVDGNYSSAASDTESVPRECTAGLPT